jgi:hypothetical protein
MPLVRRALGSQPKGALGVEKAGDPGEREVAARVETRLARPAGVALLRGRL